MIIDILLLLAAVVVIIPVMAALQPSDFRITRSITTTAPAAVVFAQVNDLHKFQAWSPWAKVDPGAKQTFEGLGEGPGAIFRWAGNNRIGAGSMTVTGSKPGELVALRLDFLKPYVATNLVEFTFKPDGGQTLVTWDMTGRKNFVPKIFCMFMSMDKMVDGEFEKGLADLKTISESAAGK